MENNISRLKSRLDHHKVPLRPHVKTCKSIEVARLLMPTPAGPITVSTLKEAEQFFNEGITDILYAVGIVPAKLPRVIELRNAGCDLSIILDNMEASHELVIACQQTASAIPVLIEVDSDGHRAGVKPDDPLLLELARVLQEGGAEFRGVMTHAGSSYDKPGIDAIRKIAMLERSVAVMAAENLRKAGLPCPEVSVGSTPTAMFADDLTGITEVRAGVFVFYDLVMAGLGVCEVEDIAISVLTSVIGHQKEKGWILVDAGWMAMSRDRGTASQPVDQGYGIVCDSTGKEIKDLIMTGANQEHGILSIRNNSGSSLPDIPVGTMLRILPNHACATASQFSCYHIIESNKTEVSWTWPRFSGW